MKRKVDYSIVIEMYKSGMGYIKIAKQLGIARTTVQKIIKKNGISDISRIPNSKVESDILVNEYQKGYGTLKLSKKFNMSEGAVRRRLRKKGVLDSNRQFKKKKGSRRSRRTNRHEFKELVKKERFYEEKGCCQFCKKLIGDGINYKQAIYHHIQPVCKGGDGLKDNCMVLHLECHNENFFDLHGFYFKEYFNYKPIDRIKRKIIVNDDLLLELYFNTKLKIKEISKVMEISIWVIKRRINELDKEGRIDSDYRIKRKEVEKGSSRAYNSEILYMINIGKKPAEIAKELGISDRAVYYRLSKIKAV